MFRKMMAVIMALAAVLILAACGGETAPLENAAQPTQTTAAPAQTTAPVVSGDETPVESASAETVPAAPVAKVDEAKLKNIQDRDTFSVKVDALTLQENHYQEFSWDGNDAMLTTVTNHSGEKIKGFTLVVLTVDQNGKDVGMDTLGGSMITKSQADKLKCSSQVMMLVSDIEMTPGQSKKFANRCNMEKFENAYMIVYSYIDASGNEVINENALDWLCNTKPVANG